MIKILIVLILVLPAILFLAVYLLTNPTSASYLSKISIPVSKKNLYECVAALVDTEQFRNYLNTGALNQAADFIQKKFEASGGRVDVQEYGFGDNLYKNVICSFGPEEGERIVIGAHYDVCEHQPGADDNASGVAGLLEIARLLGVEKPDLKCRVELAAYTLEEPPFFKTGHMGSAVHARSLADKSVPVREMVSLEMIGYYTDKEDSQRYPLDFFKWFYPERGNFIAVVGNLRQFALTRRCKDYLTQASQVAVFSINAPALLPGIDLSDHQSFWRCGFPAVMVTDTAFYRNENYHQPGDTIDTLDFDKMAEVVKGVYWYLINRARA